MRRLIHALFLTGIVAGSLVGSTSDARAADAPGTLTLHSDPGDFVGGGKDHSYTRPFDQVFWRGSSRASGTVGASVKALNGDSWHLVFAAPFGQVLQVGEYTDAQRYSFQEAGHPGMSVTGAGGCNTLTGSFTVLEIEYGPDNVVTRFHATFEQHCEGGPEALRGEVVLTPSPPLPPLEYTMTINRIGTLTRSGQITATGTLTCYQYVHTTVNVTLSQGDGFNSASAFS